MNALVSSYQQVTQATNLRVGQVSMTTEVVSSDHETLLKKIAEFAPSTGWFCCQSAVHQFDDGEWQFDKDIGRVLYGEVVRGSSSMHIQRAGFNATSSNAVEGWRITWLDATKGDDVIVKDVTLVQRKPCNHAYLKYEVYWRHCTIRGYRQQAYRFCGFVDEES